MSEVEEDVDVAAERARVDSGRAASDSLCLKNLRKAYGSRATAKVGNCFGTLYWFMCRDASIHLPLHAFPSWTKP